MAEITMITSDDKKLKVDLSVMKVCKPIEEFYKDNQTDTEIILSEVKSNTLARIIEFCKQYHNKSPPIVEKPLKTNKLSEAVKDEWLESKLQMPLNELYELINACDYLGLESFENLAACAVAVKIVGKDVQEIRKEFGIVNDYTAAEENEIKDFFSWSDELWP
jgi:S-phase kinase-associated protein 1